MVSARLANFERQLTVSLSPLLDPRQRAKRIAAFAAEQRDQTIAEQTARGGMAPVVQQTVDGRKGAALDSIRPGGQIRFDFFYMREIARFALDWLYDNSPVRSGAYRSAHLLLWNGAAAHPEGLPGEASEITILNPLPYARKIQLRGASKVGVPPGIYDRARKAVQNRFGNVVTVQLIFTAPPSAYVLAGQQLSQAKRHARQIKLGGPNVRGRSLLVDRKDARRGEKLRVPALVIANRF